jgi:hypothetical protein
MLNAPKHGSGTSSVYELKNTSGGGENLEIDRMTFYLLPPLMKKVWRQLCQANSDLILAKNVIETVFPAAKRIITNATADERRILLDQIT